MPPKRPDFYEDEKPIDNPDGWTGGEAVHTGGGMWVRKWEKVTDDGRRIELAYADFDEGISLNHYPDADEYVCDDSVGGLGIDGPYDSDEHTDENKAKAASRLMRTINIVLGDAE